MDEAILNNELTKFNVTDAAIAELAKNYLPLVINGMEDRVGFAKVHAARMDVKNRRVAVQKTGKELREDAVKYQKAVIAEEKRIIGLLDPIESHLLSEEGKIESEKARLKAIEEEKAAALLQKRIDSICEFGAVFNGQAYSAYDVIIPVALVKVCNEEQFSEFIALMQAGKDTAEAKAREEEEARQAERDRMARIEAEQKAEAERLAAIARKQEEEAAKIKAEQDEKEWKIREAQEAIEAEKARIAEAEAARLKAIEDENKRIENERIRAKELEEAKKEAAEKAIREAAEKAKREAEEKAEKERLAKIEADRKAARAPDKEKLLALVEAVSAIMPTMKTGTGKTILGKFEVGINTLKVEAEAM